MKPVVALAALPLLAVAAFAAAPARADGWHIDFEVIFGHRHCEPPPVVVERKVVVERPVIVERPVVVERNVYVERPAADPCYPPEPCHDSVVVVERPACHEPPAGVVHEDCRPFARVEYRDARDDHHADRREGWGRRDSWNHGSRFEHHGR